MFQKNCNHMLTVQCVAKHVGFSLTTTQNLYMKLGVAIVHEFGRRQYQYDMLLSHMTFVTSGVLY